MNNVVLMGRLTRDPETRTSSTGNVSATYTLAIDRRRREGQEQTADFIRCVVFGKGAEFAQKFLHQGMKVAVRGRIQTGSYTNRDGQKVYTTDVVVDEHWFADGPRSAQEPATATSQPYTAPTPQQAYTAPQQAYVAPQQAPASQQAQTYVASQPEPGYYQGAMPQPDGDGFTSIPDGIEDDLPWS